MPTPMLQLMYSFKGHHAPPEILAGVQAGSIRAFCLFANINFQTPAQVRDLCMSLRAAAQAGGQPVPIIGVDQEGGQLIAITQGATELPGNMALGATRSTALAEKAGRVLGRELLAMGVNMNFAPSVDVNNNPQNPGIGIRSFGDDPVLVGELGAAQIQGMQAEGVLAVAKHFLGSGDVSHDAHYAAPVVPHSQAHLRQTELLPFQQAIAAQVSSIMSAHVVFSAFDDRPATISPIILKSLLRDELGFTGLCITDAMDMAGVNRFGTLASVTAALEAGIDLALLGHLPDQLSIAAQVAHLADPAAAARIEKAQAALTTELPPLSIVGCAEHQAIAQEIADHSITLVRDQAHLLPLQLPSDARIAVITPRPQNLTPADTSAQVEIQLAAALQRRHAHVQALQLDFHAPDTQIQDILQATENADVVVVGTITAEHDEAQAALVKALHERGKRLIVVALRTPYDVVAFPMIDTYLCAYGIRAVTTEAIAKVLFGEIAPLGTLPCQLPISIS